MYVSKTELPALQKVIDDYETEDGVRLSDAEIKAKMTRDRKAGGALKELANQYANTNLAVTDYLVNIKYNDGLKLIVSTLKTSLVTASTLSTTMNNELLEVLNFVNTFKQLVNKDVKHNAKSLYKEQLLKAKAAQTSTDAEVKTIKAEVKALNKIIKRAEANYEALKNAVPVDEDAVNEALLEVKKNKEELKRVEAIQKDKTKKTIYLQSTS